MAGKKKLLPPPKCECDCVRCDIGAHCGRPYIPLFTRRVFMAWTGLLNGFLVGHEYPLRARAASRCLAPGDANPRNRRRQPEGPAHSGHETGLGRLKPAATITSGKFRCLGLTGA